MFIDSHCHLNFPQLKENLDEILASMKRNQVDKALCANVCLEDYPELLDLADHNKELFCSVGVHPEYDGSIEPTVENLIDLSRPPKVVAIGECGLDYYHATHTMSIQKERFSRHIQAALATDLPLIIHTRAASEDTIQMLREQGGGKVRGVLHCFTESWEVAQQGLELGLYISFSGIVTFKSAKELQEVAKKVPLDRLLIETDSPYLAPVPYRGKVNDPSKVIYVAEQIAQLREMTVAQVASQSTKNFYRLFNKIESEY